MEALRATTDELRTYPGVTVRLEAYAGPQCYPHIAVGSLGFRGRANERRLEDEQDVETRTVGRQRFVGGVGGPLKMKGC